MAVDDAESLRRAVERIGYPCVLKTRTLGYDGHGQAVLRSAADLPKGEALLSVPCILEEFIPFDFEASVVLVADERQVICFRWVRTFTRMEFSICASFRRRWMSRCGCG